MFWLFRAVNAELDDLCRILFGHCLVKACNLKSWKWKDNHKIFMPTTNEFQLNISTTYAKKEKFKFRFSVEILI